MALRAAFAQAMESERVKTIKDASQLKIKVNDALQEALKVLSSGTSML